MLKIIIIVAGYTLNNFTNSYHNTIVDDGNLYNFKTKKQIHFFTHTHTQTRCPHTQKRLVKSLPTNLSSSLVQSNLAISDKLILRLLSRGVRSQKVSTCIMKQVLVGVLKKHRGGGSWSSSYMNNDEDNCIKKRAPTLKH